MREWLNRTMENDQDRTAAITAVSFVINVLIGIGHVVMGVSLFSGWFLTNAAYYLILCIARGQTLRKYAVIRQTGDVREQHDMGAAVYRRGGIFLCMLGATCLLVCLRMYFVGDAAVYGGHVVYLVAAIAFAKLAFAICGTAAARRLQSPVISVLRNINFADALVSIVVTQYTLLTMKASSHAMHGSAVLGMGCSVLFVIMGIYMLFKKKGHLQLGRDSEQGKNIELSK